MTPFPRFFSFLKLAFSLPGLIISFYVKRRKAVKRFKAEMIACGVPPAEARELSEMYNIGITDFLKMTRRVPEA